MIDRSRHAELQPLPWDAAVAKAAIEEIVADARAHFDPERFWPAHPLEDDVEDGNSNVYFGAAGTIWALDYLRRERAAHFAYDFVPVLPRLLDATRAEMAKFGGYGELGSLLFGDMGTALVAMRLAPSADAASLVYRRVEANLRLPVRELMWGMPGSMLACLFMHGMTNEPRWRALFEEQAARLLDDLQETEQGPLWTQDLYGDHHRWLGPVHGYAGNMIPLLRGWNWLSETQRARVSDAAPRTLAANACRSDTGATWKAIAADSREPYLCQHCHGAPGMVTVFSDAPFSSPALEELLIEGARFTWAAGPLAKGANLCHGTGGNGYAFLKLYRRTKDELWLERARTFAMTAIEQCREARAGLGRGRYSLWTGDMGLAVYLWDCLTAQPRFPTVDAL
jgi:Lanthionine synthetase C-like protein